MEDIVERLRNLYCCSENCNAEAANEIERLRVDLEEYRRDVERLREALESFSCECETEDDCCAVTGSFCGWEACAALKEGDGPERCICPSHWMELPEEPK